MTAVERKIVHLRLRNSTGSRRRARALSPTALSSSPPDSLSVPTELAQALVATPGLTGISDLAEARRLLLEDSLRGVELVRGSKGPSWTSAAAAVCRESRSRSRCRSARCAARGDQERKCVFLREHAPPNARVVWGRAEEQETDWATASPLRRRWRSRRSRRSGACRSCARAARSSCGLGLAWTRERSRTVAGTGRRGARGVPRRAPCFAQIGADAEGLSAANRGGQEASARIDNSRPGGRNRLCAREPEGRRRQDDDRDQPRGVSCGGRRARADHRPRSAGECDVGARRARGGTSTLRPALRRAAPRTSSSRRGSRISTSPVASPSSRAPRSSLRSTSDGERYPRAVARAPRRATSSSSSTARRRSAR